jgi:hypothetical protein
MMTLLVVQYLYGNIERAIGIEVSASCTHMCPHAQLKAIRLPQGI